MHPPILLESDENSDANLIRRNTQQLLDKYCTSFAKDIPVKNKEATNSPRLYFINLIDKKGGQGQLGQRWFAALASAFLVEQQKEDPSNKFQEDVEENLPSLEDRKSMTTTNLLLESSHKKKNHIHKLSPRRELPARARWIWFDYHYQVKHYGVESLRNIHRMLLPALSGSRGGFFSYRNDSESKLNASRPLYTLQRNIIRSNCVDCLDRTNVMQVTKTTYII